MSLKTTYYIVAKKHLIRVDNQLEAEKLKNKLNAITKEPMCVVSWTNSPSIRTVKKTITAYTSDECKVLPEDTIVKVGKRYTSGLVRCLYGKKTFIIHEKHLKIIRNE
jgi:hypothetical protein